MAANDVIPFHDPGDAVTCRCETAVVGKRFVALSGPRVDGLPQVSKCTASAADALANFGVAARDKAIGADVLVFGTGMVPVIVGAVAVVAGTPCKSDANGEAIVAPAATVAAGVFVDDAIAGAEVMVKLGKFTVPA